MLHEKPNDSFHWKNKLDELDHLPGEPVQNKTSSWERLHDRLREKPTRKKVVWYWVAAACLVLLMGIQWMKMNEKDDQIVTDKRQYIPEQSFNTPEIVKKDAVVNLKKSTVKKKQANPNSFKNENHHVITNTAVKDEHRLTDADSTKKSLPEIMVEIIKPEDAISIIAAQEKKKMRVVHINELGKSVEEIQFARKISSPAFQAKLFNQDGLSSFSISKNASDNLVKIKLSPSN